MTERERPFFLQIKFKTRSSAVYHQQWHAGKKKEKKLRLFISASPSCFVAHWCMPSCCLLVIWVNQLKSTQGWRGWGVFNCNEKNEQHNPYSSSLFNETILHSRNTAPHCNAKEGNRDYMTIAKQALLSCINCCGAIHIWQAWLSFCIAWNSPYTSRFRLQCVLKERLH